MSTASPTSDPLTFLLQELPGLAGEQAIARLHAAAEEFPHDARFAALLAAEFAQQGAYDAAEANFMVALMRDPQLSIARFQLGLLQYSSARPATASVTWQGLSALPEDHPLRLFRDGLNALAASRNEEGIRLLKAGIAANTVHEPLNRDMQRIIDGMGNVESEESHFLMSAYTSQH